MNGVSGVGCVLFLLTLTLMLVPATNAVAEPGSGDYVDGSSEYLCPIKGNEKREQKEKRKKYACSSKKVVSKYLSRLLKVYERVEASRSEIFELLSQPECNRRRPCQEIMDARASSRRPVRETYKLFSQLYQTCLDIRRGSGRYSAYGKRKGCIKKEYASHCRGVLLYHPHNFGRKLSSDQQLTLAVKLNDSAFYSAYGRKEEIAAECNTPTPTPTFTPSPKPPLPVFTIVPIATPEPTIISPVFPEATATPIEEPPIPPLDPEPSPILSPVASAAVG